MKELILGGARSGKSAWAERRAGESGLEVVFVATATAGDDEMAARIARHRANRPGGWLLVEEPVSLAVALRTHAADRRCLVVDCLTLWLSNVLFPSDPVRGPDVVPDEPATDALFEHERTALLDALSGLPGHIILISNEVGLGVVPLGAGTRRFRDEAGRLHQDLARLCDRVTLMVAGLPLAIKPG